MNIRSKFDGGKQINRSQRGSWEGRCAGAALRVNEGPEWGPTCWEKVTNSLSNQTYKTHRHSRRSGRSGKCRTKYFSSSPRYYKNIIYLALSAAIIAKYSYITFQSTRELWHSSIQHHVVYAMVVIT